MTQATRSALMSVATTLAENIDATQDYIPVASTTNFSTSVVAEIETTNEVVSFTDISENRIPNSSDFTASNWTALTNNATFTANQAVAPDGTTTAASLVASGSGTSSYMGSVDVPSVASVMTFSCFVKGSGFLQIYTNTFWISTGFVNINAADGVIGSSATVANISSTSVGNDWYRVQFSFPSSSVVANGMIFIGSMDSNTAARAAVSSNTVTNYIWGWQMEAVSASGDITTYLPTDGTSALFGLTGVTRGANGTTAASASSGDSIQQLPYALLNVDMPVRLQGLSVSSDGTGAGRLTLCDKVGTHLCDVDIPDTKIFDLTFDGGILFPNGIYVANSDNITAYTLYTSGYNSPNLTAGG